MTKKYRSILVTGKSGQLGQSLKLISSHYDGFDFVFIGREELDFSNNMQFSPFFEDKQFDVIINCAAYTAVDSAEQDPELADKVNHQAVLALADYAKSTGTVLIHISTDYVFNGCQCRPYVEQDVTNPIGVYGISKLKGEQAILNSNPIGLIIRTSWVYSEFGHNFVKTMLKQGLENDQLNVVFDQVGTPTYALDLAKAIMTIIESRHKYWPLIQRVPLYHYSNEGVCSWYDFARSIFDLSGLTCQLNAIESNDYPTPVKRPHFSVLNKQKIKQDYHLNIPYWKESLASCLSRLQEEVR